MAAGNPDEQNQTNSLTEHHMMIAIDTVLGNTEQNYKDFLGCFVELKKEDVLAHQARQLEKRLTEEEEQRRGQRSKAMTPIDSSPLRLEEEEIEFEELDEGHYAPTRHSTSGQRFVQMDNFVEDAELLDDDDNSQDDDEEITSSSPYESSFGTVDDIPATTSPLKLSADILGRIKNDGDDDADEDKTTSASHLGFGDGGGSEMRTLPGEAEDENERDDSAPSSSLSDDAVHRTELKMTTRRSLDAEEAGQEKSVPTETVQMSTDEVQPFTLDNDFDYDNVVLTPKWDSNHGPPGWNPGN